jgi:hypothetical protein
MSTFSKEQFLEFAEQLYLAKRAAHPISDEIGGWAVGIEDSATVPGRYDLSVMDPANQSAQDLSVTAVGLVRSFGFLYDQLSGVTPAKQEREGEVQAEIMMLRSLANLGVSICEVALTSMGLSSALISKRNVEMYLEDMYEGISQLAKSLGSWERAVAVIRENLAESSISQDMAEASRRLIHETQNLFTE